MERIYYSQNPDSAARRVTNMFGPKLNQASPLVDVWECGRRQALNDHWAFHCQTLQVPEGWSELHMPFYDCGFYSDQIRTGSQALGNFQYVVVHFQTYYTADTVRFDNSYIPACRRSFWTSDTTDVHFPRFPELPVFPIIYPDPNDDPGVYRMAWDSLGVPTGTYQMQVKTAHDSVIHEEEIEVGGRSGGFELRLSLSELEKYPSYVDFVGEGRRYSAILGGYESSGAPLQIGGGR